MNKSASYILSAYSFIFSAPLDKLLEAGYQSKDGNPIPSFDEDLLIQLCSDAQLVFENEPNVLDIDGDLIIVGDIHGSFHDLLRILHFIKENDSKVLFLGDYVDRGSFSIECVTILFALKVMYPDKFYLIRGNHEFDAMCSQYGFKSEILNYHNPKRPKNFPAEAKTTTSDTHFLKSYFQSVKETQCDEYYANHKDANCYKYTEKLYDAFIQSFSYLPLGAIANKTTFCIHGGLSPRLENVKYLRTNISRPINNFEDNRLFSDLIWSDPTSDTPYLFGDNPRGRGYLFNTDAVDSFLYANRLKRMIRAHQCIKNGSITQFKEKCITVFSASSYSREMENNSAILQLFEKDDKLNVITFPPLKRLLKSDTAYYKVQSNSKKNKQQNCFSIRHPKLTSDTTVRMRHFNHCITPHRSDLNMSRLSNLMFITNSRKTNNKLIRKPSICHSTSLKNISDQFENEVDNDTRIEATQSLMSLSHTAKLA